MSGKFLIIWGLSGVLFSGCAKKNYIADDSPPPQNTAEDTKDPSSGSGVAQAPKGCEAPIFSQGVCWKLTWQKRPTETQVGSFILEFHSLENLQTLRDPEDLLSVALWMPSMGHGSSPVKIRKLSDGIFSVERVYFIMPGEWEIFIRFKKNEALMDQVVQKVAI